MGYGQDLGLEWNSLQAGDKKQAVEMTGEYKFWIATKNQNDFSEFLFDLTVKIYMRTFKVLLSRSK